MMAKTASGPAGASIFILPLARRVGRIREVVAKYDRLKGGRAYSYRDRVIDAERAALAKLGLHPDAIDREIHAFNEAVRSERTLRHYGHLSDVPQETESGGSAA